VYLQLTAVRRASLVADEQWLFQDIKKQAPMMKMVLHPVELEEILNRGVYRMKLKTEDAHHVKNPLKAVVPMEKTGNNVSFASAGKAGQQPAVVSERHRLPPLSTFKSKRGVVKDRTP
jgi:hypothetical protein